MVVLATPGQPLSSCPLRQILVFLSFSLSFFFSLFFLKKIKAPEKIQVSVSREIVNLSFIAFFGFGSLTSREAGANRVDVRVVSQINFNSSSWEDGPPTPLHRVGDFYPSPPLSVDTYCLVCYSRPARNPLGHLPSVSTSQFSAFVRSRMF